jgi:adenylate kinase
VQLLVEKTHKKVVIVGIPGVGKTSLVTAIVEKLYDNNVVASIHSYGTLMLEEAKSFGVKDRDELRRLPVEKQKELQKNVAEKISYLTDDVIFIDTHAFISTKEGFYPGLPNHVIQIIQPTHFIAISARPEEIYNRRMKDETRSRDKISIESIKKELAIQDSMLSTCSVLSGSPMKVILNNEGKIEEAANNVINAIGV